MWRPLLVALKPWLYKQHTASVTLLSKSSFLLPSTDIPQHRLLTRLLINVLHFLSWRPANVALIFEICQGLPSEGAAVMSADIVQSSDTFDLMSWLVLLLCEPFYKSLVMARTVLGVLNTGESSQRMNTYDIFVV